MAIRDIYETGFDEDVQSDSSTNQCPECDGHVTTNVKETVCEDCGLVIEEQRLDHGPECRAYDADDAIAYLRGHSEPLPPEYEATINLWLTRIDGTDQRPRNHDTGEQEATEPNDNDHDPHSET